MQPEPGDHPRPRCPSPDASNDGFLANLGAGSAFAEPLPLTRREAWLPPLLAAAVFSALSAADLAFDARFFLLVRTEADLSTSVFAGFLPCFATLVTPSVGRASPAVPATHMSS